MKTNPKKIEMHYPDSALIFNSAANKRHLEINLLLKDHFTKPKPFGNKKLNK